MKKILSAMLVLALVAAAILLFACTSKNEGPHVHVYTYATVAPTCVSEGYTEHKCLDCGDYYRDDFTVADKTELEKNYDKVGKNAVESTSKAPTPLYHVMGEWSVYSEADHDNNKQLIRECAHCSYQQIIELKNTNHHLYHEDYRILVPATCTEKAYYIYLCIETGCETYAPDKDGKSVKDMEGKSFGLPEENNAALGHDHPIIREVAATCGHNADGTAYATYGIVEYGPCTRCGATKAEEYTDPHNPDKNKNMVLKETEAATCASVGYKIYTCAECGGEYVRNYETASHSWSAWGNVYAKDDGSTYRQRYCTACGAIEEEFVEK